MVKRGEFVTLKKAPFGSAVVVKISGNKVTVVPIYYKDYVHCKKSEIQAKKKTVRKKRK